MTETLFSGGPTGRYVTDDIYCFEQDFKGRDGHPPVRLVVFDCDETLTVSTFLPKDQDMKTEIGWTSPHAGYITDVNFVPPWNPYRLIELQNMLAKLAASDRHSEEDSTSPKRVLAVLTRNQCGAVACLNLLMAAGLAEHLSAVWSMGKTHDNTPTGVYKDTDGSWHTFMPPLQEQPDHKPDALASIARDPEAWFPQGCPLLAELRLEEIVLVDDAKNNFQSYLPKRGPIVLRGCKVSHYDCVYRDMGWIPKMGGIGSHRNTDFQDLVNFINEPWKCKPTDWSSKM
jgi:hypothetical protein